jgi:beta-xylosidase
MRSRSGLVMLEKGEAELLAPIQYPESLKRFLRRERLMVHVRLSAAMRRKLELKARRTGIPPDELARRWIEHGLRNAV